MEDKRLSAYIGLALYCKFLTANRIFVYFAVFAACIATALEIDVEQYKHLQSTAIFDPTIPDGYVNELVYDGVASQDPVIFKLALQTINTYVEHHIEERLGVNGTLPARRINEISGLKETLINHWKHEHAKHEHNVARFLLEELRSEAGRGILSSALEDQEVESNPSGEIISETLNKWLEAQHPWLEIPQSLCVLWPQDDAVHTLIWESYQNDDSIEPRDLLRLLNLGNFVTPVANHFRIAQLIAYPIGSRPDAEQAISFAARGLALSHPEEAIANLVRAGYDHIDPRPEILITLAGYEDSQLNPYHFEIMNLISSAQGSTPADERYANALDRLKRYVNKPFYDRWLSSLRHFFD